MPRGGTRIGAGAPIGNTNAFRHGLRSPRTRVLARALLATPESRCLFLAIIRKQSKKQALFKSKILTFF